MITSDNYQFQKPHGERPQYTMPDVSGQRTIIFLEAGKPAQSQKLLKWNMKIKNIIGIAIITVGLVYWIGQSSNQKKIEGNETFAVKPFTDPWITTKINDLFIKTPDELKLTSTTIPENFRDIYKEMATYSIENARYLLMCQSVSFKNNSVPYQLDKGAEGIINNVLFSLKCHDMKFEKLNSAEDFVVYEAVAKCSGVLKVMDLKIILFNNRTYSTFVLYKAADSTFGPVAERILNSISKIKNTK